MIVAAALGAGFASLSFLWLIAPSERGPLTWLRFGVVVVVMYVASLRFFDPFQDFLARLFRTSRDHDKTVQSRWVRILLLGIALSFGFGERVIEEVLTKNPLAFSLELIGSMLTVGFTTFLWIYGAHCQPPRAAWWSAAGYGLSSEAIAIVLLAIHVSGQRSNITEATTNAYAAYLVKNSAAGFLAGWIFDRKFPNYRGTAGCFSLFLGLLLFDALAIVVGENPLESVLSELALCGGWALGLVICPHSPLFFGPGSRLPKPDPG